MMLTIASPLINKINSNGKLISHCVFGPWITIVDYRSF